MITLDDKKPATKGLLKAVLKYNKIFFKINPSHATSVDGKSWIKVETNIPYGEFDDLHLSVKCISDVDEDSRAVEANIYCAGQFASGLNLGEHTVDAVVFYQDQTDLNIAILLDGTTNNVAVDVVAYYNNELLFNVIDSVSIIESLDEPEQYFLIAVNDDVKPFDSELTGTISCLITTFISNEKIDLLFEE